VSTHVRLDQQLQAPTQPPTERAAADAKLQDAFQRAMTRGSRRDLSQHAASEPQRPFIAPWNLMSAAPMPLNEVPNGPPFQHSSDPELASLLERFSSQVYVAEGSRTSQPRVFLTLQGESPGASAAAEVIREGAFLRVRLRAGTAATYERMQSRLELLRTALAEQGRSNVIVEVVREQGAGGGGAR
jgi:hypothetical protein